MTFPPPSLIPLAQELVTLLQSNNETVSFVETTTGGLITSTILSLPGTSKIFKGGVLAYSLPSRKAFLGWDESLSQGYDGPTESIVLHLASSLQTQLGTTYSLAESGVAGPTLSPVYRAEIDAPGYLPIAIVDEGGRKWSKTVRVGQHGTERGEMMLLFAKECLTYLIEVVKERHGNTGEGKL